MTPLTLRGHRRSALVYIDRATREVIVLFETFYIRQGVENFMIIRSTVILLMMLLQRHAVANQETTRLSTNQCISKHYLDSRLLPGHMRCL